MRQVSLIAALAMCAALLSGCVGEPAPVMTTPLFANEDEAFAAAEATYRAYVDALNAEMSDPQSAADPTRYLTGVALDSELASISEMGVSGERLTGSFQITAVDHRTFNPASGIVTLGTCLDVSLTGILNASNEDVTPSDRSPLVPLEVVIDANGTDPLIAEMNGERSGTSC